MHSFSAENRRYRCYDDRESYAQEMRKQRARDQKEIFLLDFFEKTELDRLNVISYHLLVSGTTKNIYNVYIQKYDIHKQEDMLSLLRDEYAYRCTCKDFERRQKPCKHIYFCINNCEKIYSQHMADTAEKAVPDDDIDNDSDDDNYCCICFGGFNLKNVTQQQQCFGCKKFIHTLCVEKLFFDYKKLSKYDGSAKEFATCPLCCQLFYEQVTDSACAAGRSC